MLQIDEHNRLANDGEYTYEYNDEGNLDAAYDEFGNTSFALGSKVGHAGRFWDEGVGLYQSRARWYDPNSGRFISKDPIGFADGPNPYRYAGNNPILFVDPTGLCSENAYPLNNLAGGFATGTVASRPSIIDSSFSRPFSSFSNTSFPSTSEVFLSTLGTGASVFDRPAGLSQPNPLQEVNDYYAARNNFANNQLLLVDSRELPTLDRLLLDPYTPPIAEIKQLGGGPGRGLLQEATQYEAVANRTFNSAEAFMNQYYASGRRIAGSFLQNFAKNTPSYEITYVSGRTETILGGDINTEAAINTFSLASGPLFSGQIGKVSVNAIVRNAADDLVSPSIRNVADNGIDLLTYSRSRTVISGSSNTNLYTQTYVVPNTTGRGVVQFNTIDDDGRVAPKTNARGPYSHLDDHPSVGPSKKFTALQKKKIIEANKARNGGVIRDDRTGELLQQAKQHKKGVTPPNNEAQIDHVKPKSLAGPNRFGNAEVRSRLNNLKKSNKLE